MATEDTLCYTVRTYFKRMLMIHLFMIVFLYVGSVYSMQYTMDPIDQDYAVLIPYVVQRLQLSADDFPFELLTSLAQPNNLINSSVSCEYLSSSEHVAQIIRKQRIKMGRDYAVKKTQIVDNAHLRAWFIAYFQDEIVPAVKRDLRKERNQKEKAEFYSSSGI